MLFAVVCGGGLLALSQFSFSADDGQPLAKLELKQGDHISIVGNTLADRMQHDGWLEAYLYSRFPNHDLVVRNLGFSGDELNIRPRSDGFGSPDEHLTRNKADVVLAMFGYNESFAGYAGVEKFKHELEDFIKHTQSQKYNGQSAPRLVLFSPIAHEDLHDPNLPNGNENNPRLEMYTRAMAEVAKAHQIPFVDLYDPTLKLYSSASKPLTINGVHLNERGDQQVAAIVDAALFAGQPQPQRDPAALEKLRQAIIDKDFTWFNRYRTTDGYSIYGGRADLSFVDGQTNRVVAQREMEVLDVMTANRDKRVWAVAKGQDLTVDDSNTPPFLVTKTNRPGKGPNGEHIFKDPDDEIKTMTVAKGMKVTLFASEKEFPELAKPVQMAFDAKGRLWVAAWPTYPHWKPKEEMNDKILILEDTKGTGHADKCTVFADHLHCPTGFEFATGGVLVAQAPDVMLLTDSRGGDKADTRVRVLDGIDSADTHHTANSFSTDPGGAIYFQEGTFMHTQVETPWAPALRNANAGVYRYEPKSQKFDAYVTFGFANPHGHAWDRWGEDIVIDGTGANPYNGALFSGHLEYPEKHDHPPQVYQQRTRPCPGAEFLSSRHFPPEMQGNLLVGNVIGFQGILQYKVEDKGASLTAHEVEPILSSTDENFRPSDLKIGPDGAIYFLDWQNPIIGHMQHNLRDPSRDRTHGRIYRVTYEGRPLLTSPKIAGEPIEKLLDLLKEPEDRVRQRSRLELSTRDTRQVVAATAKWAAGLDAKDPDYAHQLTEALWVHQGQNWVNLDLLKQVLALPDFHARAAATRVLCYWRDRVPGALEMLTKLADDENPRVRLEAVRAASFFTTPEAMEVVLVSQEHPTDQYLDFIRKETLRALDPFVKKAIAENREIKFRTAAGAKYFLKNVDTIDLVKIKRSPALFIELLSRKGVADAFRQEAATGLAKEQKKSEVQVMIDTIHSQDEHPTAQSEGVAFDLTRLMTDHPAAELTAARGELESLALTAKQPLTRQLGFLALVAADGNPDKAWTTALKSASALRDMLGAIPLLRDPSQRTALFARVQPLLAGLPKDLSNSPSGKVAMGRYVQIELPGPGRTLTLAEVEVYSDGRNIARHGKATQISTANGGDAARAIDGNIDGAFSGGGQTHTAENQTNPWWQVDLQGEYPVESISVYNRTDGDIGKRLDGFTLKVLDGNRRNVFERKGLPAPDGKATYEVGGNSAEATIRRAAMQALASTPKQEKAAFEALAHFIASDADRQPALQAIQQIPASTWPKDQAEPVLKDILAYVHKLAPADRTSPAALDALQLADTLAQQLPKERAKEIRKELSAISVPILRLGTLHDRMSFDVEKLVVQAGKPGEIMFVNSDIMPHNFVIVQPGSLEEVGLMAESNATQPGAALKNFIPDSPKILFGSKLLAPTQSQRIQFKAPSVPGVYPFVCTYPGHFRKMYGAMYVVANLDDYRDDPAAYMASHPLKVEDPLLQFNRPSHPWKFEELAALLREPGREPDVQHGKQLFTVANCVACHKLDNLGNDKVGPDLTQLEPKRVDRLEILRDIVEPSFRINEKFQTWTIDTEDGKRYSGLLTEDVDGVRIIENPLIKCDPVVIKKANIAERTKSPVSIMPLGLLDKLSKDEIVDLVGYIAAHGKH